MKKPWANLKYVAVENSESYENETFVEVLEKFEELGLNNVFKNMVVRDYLGKELKEGDSVLFINDDSYQKGEVLTLYRNITHVVGDRGLTYNEKQQVTPETKENEIIPN